MGLIEEFLDQHNPNAYAECEKLRKNFIFDYPVERILELSLEEYCWTAHDLTFCHRLEYELQPLSSMGDMHIDGYGVYINSYNQPKVYRSLQKEYGDDYKGAFLHEKEEIVNLLNAAKEDDYIVIKESKIQQQFRYKLLSVYYPDKFFPVCTKKAAKGYCECFGIKALSSDTMFELNNRLVDWSKQNLPDDWTLYHAMAFSDWLWRKKKVLDLSFNAKDNGCELAKQIESEIDGMHLVGEVREAVVKQRVNQGVFRERLKGKQKRCILCQVDNDQVLTASHIKPWSKSLPEERLDPNNGFMMCPNHDKVFDRGLITFDDEGKIVISEKLSQTNRMFLNLADNMKIEVTDMNRKYLQYHRKYVFQN